jgi:Flp pilus assembly pilin Flp
MFDIAINYLSIRSDRRAVTALEYGLIAGVIVTVIMLGFSNLASALSTEFVNLGNSL